MPPGMSVYPMSIGRVPGLQCLSTLNLKVAIWEGEVICGEKGAEAPTCPLRRKVVLHFGQDGDIVSDPHELQLRDADICDLHAQLLQGEQSRRCTWFNKGKHGKRACMQWREVWAASLERPSRSEGHRCGNAFRRALLWQCVQKGTAVAMRAEGHCCGNACRRALLWQCSNVNTASKMDQQRICVQLPQLKLCRSP